ncbi:MAG: hypothetical protein AAGL10_01600 [Pseudomonadota bacterium]
MNWLTAALRKRLITGRTIDNRMVLNNRDPVGTGFDFRNLDAMAAALYGATADPQ